MELRNVRELKKNLLNNKIVNQNRFANGEKGEKILLLNFIDFPEKEKRLAKFEKLLV